MTRKGDGIMNGFLSMRHSVCHWTVNGVCGGSMVGGRLVARARGMMESFLDRSAVLEETPGRVAFYIPLKYL